MQIRSATPEDKPAIIDLLRKSLGESTVPKSEALWSWKHEENPFGKSYVLLSEENNMLTGLRAFMKWTWNWNGKSYKAIRAVDTATHPDFQGKGIFKKLTLKQLELCKEDGVDFVFNTPNTQSLPGYIKMGWQVQGKMPIKLKVNHPFRLAAGLLLKTKPGEPVNIKSSDEWQKLLNSFDQHPLSVSALHTPYSKDYISWRYFKNPLLKYDFITDYNSYFLIYRIKPHAYFTELRVTDFYLFNEAPQLKKIIAKQLRQTAKEHRADLLTISGNQFHNNRKYLSGFGLIPVRNAGPVITLKDINATAFFAELMNTQNWSYSLGDLELF